MTLPRRLLTSLATLTTLTTLSAAATLRAQAPATVPPPAMPYIQSIAINPLAIPFGVFSAEYEAALPSPGFTIGVGGTHFSRDDERDTWAELKAIYYPNEIAFRGFSIGLTGGVHSSRRERNFVCSPFATGCTSSRRSQTAPTLGVLASYDWLLGRQQRFRVGLGAGAKRVLRDVNSGDSLEQVYPDGRFVIGVVF